MTGPIDVRPDKRTTLSGRCELWSREAVKRRLVRDAAAHRRKNGADEGWVRGTTIERRCRAVALARTPSEAGEVDIKLGEEVRVSDFKPAGFVGVAADSGVGSSAAAAAAADISLSELSESGRRLRPAGRWRAGEGEPITADDSLGKVEGGETGSSSSSSSSTRVWS